MIRAWTVVYPIFTDHAEKSRDDEGSLTIYLS